VGHCLCTFTVPKLLRPYFLHRRELLAVHLLPRYANRKDRRALLPCPHPRAGEPQARAPADAALGPAGRLSTPQDVSAPSGAQDLSLPAARSGDNPAEPGLVRGRGAPRGALEPCGGGRPSPLARRSGSEEAEGSLIRGTPVRAESSPDNDGMGQNCQMVQVRQARREGVREKPVSESSSSANHQLESGGSGLGSNAEPHRESRTGNSPAG
jgi:hypothetical protein